LQNFTGLLFFGNGVLITLYYDVREDNMSFVPTWNQSIVSFIIRTSPFLQRCSRM